MLELLVNVIALGFASTLSPVILGITLTLLAAKNHPKARTFAFLSGNLLSALIIFAVGVLVVRYAWVLTKSRKVDYLDIMIGIVFLIFAAWSWVQNERASNIGKAEHAKIAIWSLIGFVISITNFDAVIFYFTEVKEIFQASVSLISKSVLSIIGALFFVLPVILPLAVYLIMPDKTERVLRPVGNAMEKYGKYIVTTIFIVFGIYFILRGAFLLRAY